MTILIDHSTKVKLNVISLRIKKMLKYSESEARKTADKLIKNAYRVLLTRGAKGCYVYCQDEEYRKYIKNIIKTMKFTK